jgi:alanine racemase
VGRRDADAAGVAGAEAGPDQLGQNHQDQNHLGQNHLGVGHPCDGHLRPAWADIDLGAVRHNALVLAELVAPSKLCAVVKAGGYGHGAVEVGRAALEGGASHLAVALVEEGRELRRAGITAPVLVLSEPPGTAMGEVVAQGLTPTLYTTSGLDTLRRAAKGAPAHRTAKVPVHVKVDTGMHRVGAAHQQAVALAAAVNGCEELELEGFWTHFAVSEELDSPFTGEQISAFLSAVDALGQEGIRPHLLHAANSAGAIWHPEARFDMVRCGISVYGLSPAGTDPPGSPAPRLRPAMSLKARVSMVKRLPRGERLSYGLRYRLERDSVVATVPLGYADGVTRSLSVHGGVVLVRGERRPIAGAVTMDQLLIDCGPDSEVAVGDEVVMIGEQAGQAISAWEWAERTGTIAYEVVCGISGRVPRHYSREVPPAAQETALEPDTR